MRTFSSHTHRRDQILFVVGWGVSVAGDFFAFTVLTLAIHDQTHSSAQVAAVLLAALAARIVFAPIAGRLADTRSPARVVAMTALAQAALVGAAAALALTPPMLIVLSFLVGAGAAITRPAVFVLVPRLADPDQVTKLNTRLQLGRYLGIAAGQATGGILVSTLGVGGALVVDAASFLVLAGLYPLLDPPARQRPAGSRTERAIGRRGLLTANTVVLAALAVSAVLMLFAGTSNVAEVFLAKDALAAGDSGFGILQAAWTIGVVVGLVLLAARLANHQLFAGLLAGAAVAGVATITAGAAPAIAVAVVAYAVGGAANGVAQVAVFSLIHTQVPADHHGQTFAQFAAVMSTVELCAMVAGGALVGLVGPRNTMLIGGIGMVTVAATAFALTARTRASR